jgi:hypothetical protein
MVDVEAVAGSADDVRDEVNVVLDGTAEIQHMQRAACLERADQGLQAVTLTGVGSGRGAPRARRGARG